MSNLFAVLALGILTYWSRAVFVVSAGQRRIPPTLRLALEYVAPAVLGALVVTMLMPGGDKSAIGLPELVALGVASPVALFTRNHVYTLIAGMGTFWVLRALL